MKKFLIIIFMCVLMSTMVLAQATLLSSSSVTFQSNNAEVAGPHYVILGVDNGGNDEIVFGGNKNGKLSGSGVDSEDQFTIKTDLHDMEIAYDLISTEDFVYKYRFIDTVYNFPFGKSKQEVAQECFDIVGAQVAVTSEVLLGTIYCYSKETVGERQQISGSADERFVMDVILSNGKTTEVLTVDQSDRTDKSNTGNTFVKVEGGLKTFKTISQPGQQVDFFFTSLNQGYTTDDSEWSQYVALTNKYNDYGNCFNTKSTRCVLEVTDLGQTERANDRLEQYNSEVSNLFKFKPFTEFTSRLEGSQNSGEFVLFVDDDERLVYPIFTLKVKGDFVGVIRNAGIPVISSLTTSDFNAGQDGQLIAKIKNDASVSASFSFSTVCTNGFSVANKVPTNFNGGETKSLIFSLSGETTSSDTGSCTLKVTDQATDKSVSKTVGVKVKAAVQCNNLGIQDCSNNNVIECISKDGVQVYETQTVCGDSKTCQIDGSKATCVDKSGTSDSNDNNGSFKSGLIVLIIGFVISGIVGGFSVSYLNNFIPNFKGRKWLFFVIFMLIFILLGFLLASLISAIVGFIIGAIQGFSVL